MLARRLLSLITGSDNESLDVGRLMILISVKVALFLSCWNVIVIKVPFDIQNFGIGIGALLFGGGGMLFLKKDTEPGAK